MMLTAQAFRLVAEAVRGLPDSKAREKWRSWAGRGKREDHLPPDVAKIVLEALVTVTGKLETRLGSPDLNEDQEADILNDLGFIDAIATDLKRDIAARQHA